jgi:hypothetical protein
LSGWREFEGALFSSSDASDDKHRPNPHQQPSAAAQNTRPDGRGAFLWQCISTTLMVVVRLEAPGIRREDFLIEIGSILTGLGAKHQIYVSRHKTHLTRCRFATRDLPVSAGRSNLTKICRDGVRELQELAKPDLLGWRLELEIRL